MTRPVAGRLLLAAGGLLVTLGGFLPEITVAGANLLFPRSPLPVPDRSHWVVFRESLDMLVDPDLTLGWGFYLFYAAEAGGILYLAAAGAAIAASSFFERARAAVAAFSLFHAAFLLGLSVAALEIAAAQPGEEEGAGDLSRLFLLGGFLLGGLLLGQVAMAVGVLRRSRRLRVTPVDAVNLLPAAFLLVLNVSLFFALMGHPNWPAGGYLLSASGALFALSGMALRRRAAKPEPGESRAPISV